LLAARALRIPIRRITLDLFGAEITPAAAVSSYAAELLLCLAGPAASLVSALLLWAVPLPFTREAAAASLLLGLLNLLPIRSFDGGHVLECVLALLPAKHAHLGCSRLSGWTSLLCFLFLWSFSSALLLIAGRGLPAFLFSLSLLPRIFPDASLPLPSAGKERISKNTEEYGRKPAFFRI
jgi:membrane-associated protease RseP (regulator of RpoE activity)